MPGLNQMLEIIRPMLADPEKAERLIRGQLGGERIYVIPLESRKDPNRQKRIAELSQRLPVSVVAARLSVSQSYVRKIVNGARLKR